MLRWAFYELEATQTQDDASMPWLIGADEAGYGPNYGPLVVGLSIWHVPTLEVVPQLYEVLSEAIVRDPGRTSQSATVRVAIGDSKQIYDPAGGLATLERGVLAAWSASAARTPREAASCSLPSCTWRDLWTTLDPTSHDEVHAAKWHRDFLRDVPVDGQAQLGAAADQLRRTCAATGVRLVALHARGVFPAEFNREVERLGNKAELLSLTTLALIRAALARHADARPAEDVRILCDKHGGRNHYAGLLQHCFQAPSIEVRREGREASSYRWRDDGRTTDIEFRMGGEAALPVALASMTAKYLRELAMEAFNAFWQAQVPGVAPTAGYPTDAKRFRQAIAARQRELQIDDADLWRNR